MIYCTYKNIHIITTIIIIQSKAIASLFLCSYINKITRKKGEHSPYLGRKGVRMQPQNSQNEEKKTREELLVELEAELDELETFYILGKL